MAWVDITAPANWQPITWDITGTEFGTDYHCLPPVTDNEEFNFLWDGSKWVMADAAMPFDGDYQSSETIPALQYIGPLAAAAVTMVRVTLRLRREIEYFECSGGNIEAWCFSSSATIMPISSFAAPQEAPVEPPSGPLYWYGVLPLPPFPPSENYAVDAEFTVVMEVIPDFNPLTGITAIIKGYTSNECIACIPSFYFGADIIKIEAFTAGFWTDFVKCEETDGG